MWRVVNCSVQDKRKTPLSIYRQTEEKSHLMDVLSFGFSERGLGTRLPNHKLEEIAQSIERYDGLPEAAHKFCRSAFARAMTVDFVYNLNIGESIGMQSKDETHTLLEGFLDGNESAADVQKSKEEMETINTCKGVQAFHKLHEEMKKTGLLTVQQVCGVHSVLLHGLRTDCGKIRTTDVYTHWQDGLHFYPPHEKVEGLFYSLIDYHNIHMEALDSEATTLGRVKHLFICAAWLLFMFIDVHPFADGNGRMCRLLANHVLSIITPFPVRLYHSCHSNRSGRDDYIKAIVRCRKHPEEGPRELAAMLVEGAWHGWNCLFENLQRLQISEKVHNFGPIVIQKSKIDQVGKCIKRVCGGEPLLDAQMITNKVLGETQRVDVSGLKPYQYKEEAVKVDEQTSVVIKVFP